MGTPADNPDGYRELVGPGRASASSRGELLLIHGLIDENVHFRHTARLIAALIAAGKPFEILPLPEERHSSRRKPANRKYEVERLAAFFEIGALAGTEGESAHHPIRIPPGIVVTHLAESRPPEPICLADRPRPRGRGSIARLAWAAATVYCCGYVLRARATSRAGRPLGPDDVHPILRHARRGSSGA